MLLCGGITASHPIGVVVFCDSSTAHFMGLPGLKFKCNWWCWTSKLGALDRFLPHLADSDIQLICFHDFVGVTPSTYFDSWLNGSSSQCDLKTLKTLVDLVNSQPLMCDFMWFQHISTFKNRFGSLNQAPQIRSASFFCCFCGLGLGLAQVVGAENPPKSSERGVERWRETVQTCPNRQAAVDNEIQIAKTIHRIYTLYIYRIYIYTHIHNIYIYILYIICNYIY